MNTGAYDLPQPMAMLVDRYSSTSLRAGIISLLPSMISPYNQISFTFIPHQVDGISFLSWFFTEANYAF